MNAVWGNVMQMFRVDGELKVCGRNAHMAAHLKQLEIEEKQMMERILREHGWRFREVDMDGMERWESNPSVGISVNMEFGEAYTYVTINEFD
jgi:hypothetical protein